jgi:hypothetical protein
MTLLRTIGSLLLLPLLVSQASGQASAANGPDSVMPLPTADSYRPHLASEISCEQGRPVKAPFDSSAVIWGVSQPENDLHEAVHLHQLEAACDSTLAHWQRDPIARLEAEVEATCAGFVAIPPERRRMRRKEAQQVLFELYGDLIPIDAGPPFGVIYAAFDRWCGQASP